MGYREHEAREKMLVTQGCYSWYWISKSIHQRYGLKTSYSPSEPNQVALLDVEITPHPMFEDQYSKIK